MANPTFSYSYGPRLDSFPTLSSTGPSLGVPSGQVIYVNSASVAASDNISTRGGSPTLPLKTLNYALSQVIPNNGDWIYCMPGHVETVNAAAGLNFAAGVSDGVTVFFLGAGADRAQVNYATSTAAQVVIAANNVSIWGMRCVTAIDALVAGISVTGSDCTLTNTEYFDGTAIASIIQLLTTAAANRLTINGYTYYEGTTGTAKTEAIRIVGGDHHSLTNLNIKGSFSTANINNVTTATTNLRAQNWYLVNPLTTAAGVPLQTYVSTSTFLGADVSPQSGIAGEEYAIAKTLALPQGATAVAFTVTGGPIQIMALGGLVTTAIGAVANTTKLNYLPTTGGTSTDLTTGVDLNAAAAGDLYILQTSFGTAAALNTAGVETIAQVVQEKLVYPLMVAPGTVRVICAGSDGGAGRMQWTLRYRPQSPGVLVS